jgi:hypothetical protein
MVILLVMSAGLAIAYLQTQTSVTSLVPEIGSVTDYIQALRSEYEVLAALNASRSLEYQTLLAEYDQLQSLYTQLEQNYTNILLGLGNVTDPGVDYAALLNQYLALNDTMTSLSQEYSQLAALYTEANASLTQFQDRYSQLVEQVNHHAEWMQPHGSELITPQNPLVQEWVYKITGVEVNTNINYNDDALWDDILAIYTWVANNIEYRVDGYYPILPLDPNETVTFVNDMWQFPGQTILSRQGDSEDKAILLCALLRSYSGQTMTADCMRVDDHVLCYIFTDDGRICLLDPTLGYYTQTQVWNWDIFGWEYRIGDQNVAPEMSNYFDMYGNEPVYFVFSDYVERSFASTQEFITWINDR